jgi:hypothetical protein
MPISAKRVGDQIAVGGALNPEEIEALSTISVNSNSVLEHLDALNEELEESGYKIQADGKQMSLPTVKLPSANKPQRIKSVSSLKQSLNRGQNTKPKAQRREVAQQAPVAKKKDKVNAMDFDRELEEAESQLNNEAEVEAGPADGMRDQIIELLKNTSGAPNAVQIAKWKAQFGDKGVHVMAFGEGDVYIFTHLKRGQWKKIQELMQKAQSQGQIDVEDMLKEKTISYCTLWPTLPIEFFYNSKAGVVDSLYQVILLNSYFLSPQQAMMLTTQL